MSSDLLSSADTVPTGGWRRPLAALALLLAMVPPALVILDRWFGNQIVTEAVQPMWCRVPFLCGSLWPSYFVIIFICAWAVITAVFAIGAGRIDVPKEADPALDSGGPDRWQRYLGLVLLAISAIGVVTTAVRLLNPKNTADWLYAGTLCVYVLGWFLISTPLRTAWTWVQAKAGTILAGLAGLASVSSLLYGYYAWHHIGLGALLLAAGAAALLYWRRAHMSAGYWLVLLALVVQSVNLTSWFYVWIGDEYIFYDTARFIVTKGNAGYIGSNLFNGSAVYNTMPFIDSLLQAIPLKLLDTLAFGWRYGGILIAVVSLIPFYYFFRAFLTRWVAMTATFLLAVSHYLMSFDRIGYNNPQALLAMGLALAAAASAVRNRRVLDFVATGLGMAFCFYSFPAALYALPAVLLVVLLYHPPRSRSSILHWVILLVTALLVILPLFYQLQYWTTKISGTVFDPGTQIDRTPLQLAGRMAGLFGYALFSFLYTVKESHFVTVAFMDAVSAVFVLIGLGVLVSRVFRDRFAVLALGGLAILLFGAGASQEYPYPPPTRMFMVLPWFSLIAAVGLQWLVSRFRGRGRAPAGAGWVLAPLLAVVLALNLYQAYGISVRRYGTQMPYFECLFVRLAQNLLAANGGSTTSVLLVDDPKQYDIRRLEVILEVDYASVQLHELVASQAPNLEDQAKLLASDQIVVINPMLPDQVRGPYEAFLKGQGLQECAVQAILGPSPLKAWYTSNMPNPCGGSTGTSG